MCEELDERRRKKASATHADDMEPEDEDEDGADEAKRKLAVMATTFIY